MPAWPPASVTLQQMRPELPGFWIGVAFAVSHTRCRHRKVLLIGALSVSSLDITVSNKYPYHHDSYHLSLSMDTCNTSLLMKQPQYGYWSKLVAIKQKLRAWLQWLKPTTAGAATSPSFGHNTAARGQLVHLQRFSTNRSASPGTQHTSSMIVALCYSSVRS